MNLIIAMEILNKCTRNELRDHAFGDVEVTWIRDQVILGSGYFSGGNAKVDVANGDERTTFEGSDARELRDCGYAVNVARNDVTGPDEYSEGVIMPGLTNEGVLHEIQRREDA